jgi:hypothetical protein
VEEGGEAGRWSWRRTARRGGCARGGNKPAGVVCLKLSPAPALVCSGTGCMLPFDAHRKIRGVISGFGY